MKKLFLSVLATLALLSASMANAAVVMLDAWTAPQSVTATVGTPSVSSVLPANVAGVASFLGNRTLGSNLTSALGSVQAVIGNGAFESNRSVDATGNSFASYAVDEDVTIEKLLYVATNDGAFVGTASVSFYDGLTLLATQAIAIGTASYETFLNSTLVAGDNFRIELNGSVAIDQSLRPMEAVILVPEPGSVALAGLGLLGIGFVRRRRTAAVPA